MGQTNQIFQQTSSKPRLHGRCLTIEPVTRKGPYKTLIIKFKTEEKHLQIDDNSMTCGWLLSETIRLFQDVPNIIGLRCADRIDVIDMWLQDFERPVGIIRDLTVLTPILSQAICDSPSLSWFQPISLIGKGGFSEVYLCRKRDNGQLYAVKVMKKSYIIQEKKVKNIISECKILKNTSHPFIITLRWAFQSASELFIVTDFCPGGELFFHLHNLGRFTEDQARFYFCEILLAIEHLHKERIIFRDLKPENTLIDLDGHIKLIDFGLATYDRGSLQSSFCGSHEYLSPEMIRRTGYNKCVDFYSLGSFLYEMITGLPPFWDNNREKLYEKILTQELVVPKYMSSALSSLLKGLLRKDPTLRLGSIFGVKEIKEHPWLDGVNWDNVRNKKIQPPFRPNSSRSNFEHDEKMNEGNLAVFNNFKTFKPGNDSEFREFFYENPEKPKNHDLVHYGEVTEELTSSKSFVDVKIPIGCEYTRSPTKAQESTSQSPISVRVKKIGPEILSCKVAPKFSKSSKKKESTVIIKQSRGNPCNKSFINIRRSMAISKLNLD